MKGTRVYIKYIVYIKYTIKTNNFQKIIVYNFVHSTRHISIYGKRRLAKIDKRKTYANNVAIPLGSRLEGKRRKKEEIFL